MPELKASGAQAARDIGKHEAHGKHREHGQRHRAQTAAQRGGKLRREGQRGKRRGAAAGGQRVSMEAAIGAEYLPHEREEPDAPDNGQHGQRKQADAEYRAADAARPELLSIFFILLLHFDVQPAQIAAHHVKGVVPGHAADEAARAVGSHV